MTIPTLMANHKKKVTATRIKQFASLWQQVSRSAYIESGDGKFYGTLIALDADSTYDFYNTHFSKYITSTDITKTSNGITVGLNNGSGFYFYRWSGSYDSSANTYLIFCPNYKDCNKINFNTGMAGENLANGKTTFTFYMNGAAPNTTWDGTREQLIRICKGSIKGYCTKLIEYDGWEIKDDYPW